MPRPPVTSAKRKTTLRFRVFAPGPTVILVFGADNLWLLGGEIIRHLDYDPSLRKVAAETLVRNVIHQDGGPLIHNGSEDEQRSFDSTCRKLNRFLTQSQR